MKISSSPSSLDHHGGGRRIPQPQHRVELGYQQRDRTDDKHHRDRPIDSVLKHSQHAVGDALTLLLVGV
jgi:hypothetical protein